LPEDSDEVNQAECEAKFQTRVDRLTNAINKMTRGHGSNWAESNKDKGTEISQAGIDHITVLNQKDPLNSGNSRGPIGGWVRLGQTHVPDTSGRPRTFEEKVVQT
jgi:hypothetical protein